jgi:hypothetical protein
LPKNDEQRGAGVLRVGVDLPALERVVGDVLVAEVELGLHRVPGGLQALGVDLAEDLLLGEVLRADRQRGLRVVGLRLIAPPPAARPRRRRPAAAGGDGHGKRDQRSDQPPSTHGSDLTLSRSAEVVC